MGARVGVDPDVVIAEAAFLVREGAIDELLELCNLERLQLKHLGARDQRTINVEKRVVSRSADQPEVSTLDVRQKDVLLGLIEMMDLVDKQNRHFNKAQQD